MPKNSKIQLRCQKCRDVLNFNDKLMEKWIEGQRVCSWCYYIIKRINKGKLEDYDKMLENRRYLEKKGYFAFNPSSPRSHNLNRS